MCSPIFNPGHDYGTDFYDFAKWEWNLYTNSCFWSWTRQLPESGLCQRLCCQHVSSSAVIWSKLHQILMLQTTGIVQTTVTLSYDLPHIHHANQTCYPYWNKKGLQPWLREYMVGKEITAVLMRGLSKPLRICNISNFSWRQISLLFSIIYIPAILLFCGMIYSKLFMRLK